MYERETRLGYVQKWWPRVNSRNSPYSGCSITRSHAFGFRFGRYNSCEWLWWDSNSWIPGCRSRHSVDLTLRCRKSGTGCSARGNFWLHCKDYLDLCPSQSLSIPPTDRSGLENWRCSFSKHSWLLAGSRACNRCNCTRSPCACMITGNWSKQANWSRSEVMWRPYLQ
jgi:hypothetical protein